MRTVADSSSGSVLYHAIKGAASTLSSGVATGKSASILFSRWCSSSLADQGAQCIWVGQLRTSINIYTIAPKLPKLLVLITLELLGFPLRSATALRNCSEYLATIYIMSILCQLASSASTCLQGDGSISTQPFLATCTLVLPVLGMLILEGNVSVAIHMCPTFTEQLGTGMALVKSDVGGNINRLQQRYNTDPQTFAVLDAIVEQEMARGVHTSSSSCTKGLLWLKRCVLGGVASGTHTLAMCNMQHTGPWNFWWASLTTYHHPQQCMQLCQSPMTPP